MKRMILIFSFFASTLVAAQEKAVPMEREPLHKIELTNDYVEVTHLSLQPGQKTMMHTHSHDAIAIALSESTVSVNVPGKESAQVSGRPGDIEAGAFA